MNFFFKKTDFELISDESLKILKERNQFLITLLFFVPFILNGIYGGDHAQIDANKQLVSWGSSIGFLIFEYLLIEIYGKQILKLVYKCVNVLMILNIALTIPVLFVIAGYGSTQIKGIAGMIYLFSLVGMYFLPLVIFFLTLLNPFFKKIASFYK